MVRRVAANLPNVWTLGHGVSIVGQAIVLGFAVGALLAVALADTGRWNVPSRPTRVIS
jgi:hypothetical protein